MQLLTVHDAEYPLDSPCNQPMVPRSSQESASGISKHVTIFSPSISRIVLNERPLFNVNMFMCNRLPQSQQGDWPEPTKFDQLRIKTGMQLIQLINAELDLGIRHARQALNSADMWAVAEEYHRRANRAYANASRLIPVVFEISEDEQSRVESRLELLQAMLEVLTSIGSTATPAEDEIAALARAVWDARGCPEGLPEDDWFRAEQALKAKEESNAVCVVS